jgi:hypothetical protein
MPRMRWDCEKQGCFNVKQRPKIEVFDECFERGCAFGDVDAIVENGGHFLILEWKRPGATCPRGQQILHQKLTALAPQITIVLVQGDAENMTVESVQVVSNGKYDTREDCTIDQLKDRCRAWFQKHNGGTVAPPVPR